ncbi:MAG: hypothetical protein KDB18_09995, partial [Salinibacterium sp.]|nr:hypothetical protein [Salinibacterium sp.]
LRSIRVSAPTPHGPVALQVDDGVLTVDSPRPVLVVRPDGSASKHPAGRTNVPWPPAVPA